LSDNPALVAALGRGGPIIPVYIWEPKEEGEWAPGDGSRWWLHRSLVCLDAELRVRGSRLALRRGGSLPTLTRLVRECGAGAVFWNHRSEPAIAARDAHIEAELRAKGVTVETFNSQLLFDPDAVRTAVGRPYQVFTAFWNGCRSLPPPPKPLPAPRRLPRPAHWPATLALTDLPLASASDRAAAFRDIWEPGERAALSRVGHFLRKGLTEYPGARDRPDLPGTSRLSPHLHFGEIGPRQIWHAVQGFVGTSRTRQRVVAAEAYLRQLGWREFAHHLLFHFPHTPSRPLHSEFMAFPWVSDDDALKAWQQGRTGYPIVDSAMRALWQTGWMHNRLRMIVASFLVKDLLLPWQQGAKWFWKTLVDADLANNTLGWQWVGGCGADATPYFRHFNPVRQGERFDPHGHYVRRWIPELAPLPAAWIHRPWEAPSSGLAEAGVVLGKTYPRPIVSHAVARLRALAAFAAVTRKRPKGTSPRRPTTRSLGRVST